MQTSMKKIELYASMDKCSEIEGFLEKQKLYWYRGKSSFRGGEEVCSFIIYVPIQIIEDIVDKLSSIIDLRRLENMIVVSDVEAGLGAPYRITSRRYIRVRNIFGSRPRFMIIEDAAERTTVSYPQLVLTVIASLVALSGLITNNPYIIIGAMLLSPILGPIYSFSALLALSQPRKSIRGLYSLGAMLIAAFTASLTATLFISLLGYHAPPTPEISMRGEATPATLVIALLLGAASILAVSNNITDALTGVAIAAAIIPPSAALGYAVATANPMLTAGTLANLAINIAGLLIGGTAMSLLLIHLSKKQRNTVAKKH